MQVFQKEMRLGDSSAGRMRTWMPKAPGSIPSGLKLLSLPWGNLITYEINSRVFVYPLQSHTCIIPLFQTFFFPFTFRHAEKEITKIKRPGLSWRHTQLSVHATECKGPTRFKPPLFTCRKDASQVVKQDCLLVTFLLYPPISLCPVQLKKERENSKLINRQQVRESIYSKCSVMG